MPLKPPRACRFRGCAFLTRHTSRYCELHKHHRKKPDMRPSAAKRGYDTTWQKARSAYLKAHHICENCNNKRATDVHHLDGNAQHNTWDNLKALCHVCHSSITGKTVGGFV